MTPLTSPRFSPLISYSCRAAHIQDQPFSFPLLVPPFLLFYSSGSTLSFHCTFVYFCYSTLQPSLYLSVIYVYISTIHSTFLLHYHSLGKVRTEVSIKSFFIFSTTSDFVLSTSPHSNVPQYIYLFLTFSISVTNLFSTLSPTLILFFLQRHTLESSLYLSVVCPPFLLFCVSTPFSSSRK